MRYLENDEARMTKDEGMTKRIEFRPSTLGFTSSFVIRISSLAGIVAVYVRSHHGRAGYNSVHEDLSSPPARVLIARKVNFCCLRSGLDERANIFHGIE